MSEELLEKSTDVLEDTSASDLKETILNFIVPIMCTLTSIVLIFAVIVPSARNINVLKQEEATKKDLSQQLSTKLDTLNKLLDFKSVVQENLSLFEKVLVSNPDSPKILEQVDKVAVTSNLEVTKLSYAAAGNDAVVTGVRQIPVTLGAKGNFNQLVTFLDNLENSAPLIDVENFRYSFAKEESVRPLDINFNLTSPNLKVESNAVTDEPINLDIASASFTKVLNIIKDLRVYK